MDVDKKIVVSMTSWPKRIGNVKTVFESLLNQTVKPDLIELNLSTQEFPNKEDDLPEDLLEQIKNNECIEINWVEENTGVFKKLIPTIKKFLDEDEYYLLSVDDDYIYRSDYIGMMINYLQTNKSDAFCLSKAKVIGNRMIYLSSCFNADFYEKLTQEIINNRISDYYIQCFIERYRKKRISRYDHKDAKNILKLYNPVSPNSGNKTEPGKDSRYSPQQVKRAKDAIDRLFRKLTSRTPNKLKYPLSAW